MIVSFASEGEEDIFNGVNTKAARRSLSPSLWAVAQRKLDIIHAAHTEQDLKVPPGNRFEHLKGDLSGLVSIRINDQFRIVFRFEGGNASEVRIVDYH